MTQKVNDTGIYKRINDKELLYDINNIIYWLSVEMRQKIDFLRRRLRGSWEQAYLSVTELVQE